MPHLLTTTALGASSPLTLLAQAAAGSGLSEPVSGSGGAPSWLVGTYEADFVAVSVIVGVVLTVALVVLVRRLWPSAS